MKCPKCNKGFTGRPALSREDNKTEICSECGMKEALESVKRHCIFEKRYCRYANKQGEVFNCECPSDEKMTCK